MKRLSEVFKIWPRLSDMAADIGETWGAVHKWKKRNRIPQTAWDSLITAAAARGKVLTAADLLAMHNPSPARGRHAPSVQRNQSQVA